MTGYRPAVSLAPSAVLLMSSELRSASDGKAKQVFWIVAATVLVTLVGYNLYTGRAVEEIGLGGLGSVKFGRPEPHPATPSTQSRDVVLASHQQRSVAPLVPQSVAQRVDHDEMARRQADLEAKLRQMEEALKRAESEPAPSHDGARAPKTSPPPDGGRDLA